MFLNEIASHSLKFPEECYIAIPWFLDSLRSENLQGIAIPNWDSIFETYVTYWDLQYWDSQTGEEDNELEFS